MMDTEFAPMAGLMGGVLIGLASVGVLLANGKTAGISGNLGRSFFPAAADLDWRLAFLVGLCPGPELANLLRGSTDVYLFVVAMIAGVVLYRAVTRG